MNTAIPMAMKITANANTRPLPILLTLKPLNFTGGLSVGRIVGWPVLCHTALNLHSEEENPAITRS